MTVVVAALAQEIQRIPSRALSRHAASLIASTLAALLRCSSIFLK